MKKNDCIELEITDTGTGGEGIGHCEGMAFFVKDAVIGDRLWVRVTKVKKNYGYGRVEEIITPSTFRVVPKCAVAAPCGGCQLQAMDYGAQLEWKQKLVRERLKRLGGVSDELLDQVMEPILGNVDREGRLSPYHYRNKAQYPVRRDAAGQTVIGFYGAHSHRVVETAECCIGQPVFDEIAEVVRSSHDTVPYDEETGRGLLRHLLLRMGAHTGELMVCFVVNGSGPTKGAERMTEALVRQIRQQVEGNFVSFCVNYNNSTGNVILGKRTDTILGQPYIQDTMGGIRFRISAPSFYQVNTPQAERLYEKVLEYAALTGRETVWDLYCGIGTISLFLAGRAGRVYGVEIVPEAVENARENARDNGITNAEFILGKAEEVLPAFYGGAVPGRTPAGPSGAAQAHGSVPEWVQGRTLAGPSGAAQAHGSAPEWDAAADREAALHPGVIVVDPPRKGCDEKCLETMAAMKPDRIVYVSCDPATLARDVKYLCAEGYELAAVTAADQFCHSVHVETVVLLSHKKPDTTISVKVEFGEGEGKVPLSGIESRAEERKPKERVTYKLIKEYIEAKYGFKVHTAYIAEVKRSYGLPMYDAPNAVEELKHPRKHPTPEKVEAIKDALKYYELIS